MHTAVKIAPRYEQPTIHVLDASKSVVVCASLLDDAARDGFCDEIKDEYEELRETHYEGLKDRTYLGLETARAAKCQVDFKLYRPVAPANLGTHAVEVGIEELIPFIDWKPFFEACPVLAIRWVVCCYQRRTFPFVSQVWQLRGKYPNRGYPKIFKGTYIHGT